MKINVNGVSIILTKEQLEEINKQQNKPFDFRDITSFEDACKYLGKPIPSFDCLETDEINFIKLKTIIKAINNGWEVDFSDKNCIKCYPYFETNSDGVSIYDHSDYDFVSYWNLPLGLYLETLEKAEYMGKTFKHLYDEL